MQLAEGRHVVEAGIGARVADHDQTVAHQNPATIGHDDSASPGHRREIYSGAGGWAAIRWSGGGLPAASDDQRAAQYFLAGVLGAPPQVQRRQHFGPARLAQTRLAHSMTGLTQRRFIATSALSTESGAAFAVMTCAANSAHAARPSEKLVRLLMVPSELKLPPLAAISIVIRRRGMRKPLSGR